MFERSSGLAGAVALIAGVVAAPGPARADEFSLHAILSGQTAVTTNAFSESEGAADAGSASLNYQLRPGLLFSYHTRKSLHELTADAGLDGNDFTDNVTLTYRGGYRMTYSLSPRLEAEAGAGAGGGRVNALSTTAPADMGGPGVLPTGAVDFYSLDASQSLGYQATPELELRQNAFARYIQTDPPGPNTTSYEIGGGVGVDRTFKYTAIGAQLQGSFQRLDVHDQYDVRGTVRVRRDLSATWSGALEAGVVTLIPLEPGDKFTYGPIGSAEISYFPTWGTASLAVRHSASPNLFLAQNQISDSAVINAALPLPFLRESRFEPRMTFLTSTGVSHIRFVDLTGGGDLATFNVVHADAAVQYTPMPNLAVSLRYQLVNQSDADASDPAFMMLGYLRHTVMFTFYGRWPARLAAEMPIRSGIRVNSFTPVGDANTTGVSGGGE